jgi:hypothetical protein
MSIEGNSNTTYSGVGIVIGLFAFSGVHKIKDVIVRYFDAGIRQASALWTSLYSCRFENNNYGETYDVLSGVLNRQSTTVAHYSCVFMNSKKSGVAGINVPIRNVVLSYYSCTFQDNGSENTSANPQVKLGSCGSVIFNCCYFQYSNNNPPKSMDITGIGEFQIANSYFNGGSTHIFANAQIDNGLISCNRFLGTTGTKAVDLQNNANARIHAISNVTDKAIYLGNGPTTTVITNRIKQVP